MEKVRNISHELFCVPDSRDLIQSPHLPPRHLLTPIFTYSHLGKNLISYAKQRHEDDDVRRWVKTNESLRESGEVTMEEMKDWKMRSFLSI